MIDLALDCEWHKLTPSNPISEFDCGNEDLNDFFRSDALQYAEQLLGSTYYFSTKSGGEIVCAYTLSNDSIKTYDLPNNRKRKIRDGIPREKHIRSFPATLIGRLGVSNKFKASGLGSQLMMVIKMNCIQEDGDRCRFLVVDAYNEAQVLRYYEKNDFKFLFSSEDQEKEYHQMDGSQILRTRFMYFDLLALR
ncbi:MAG: N-acetyltransferase [Bacteroidia bacterium]|nr:N-acetyltransferase [Bacteroidota bacterium]MBP6639979.1 N-acetyltransferase [Bacteroidia bacterium]